MNERRAEDVLARAMRSVADRSDPHTERMVQRGVSPAVRIRAAAGWRAVR